MFEAIAYNPDERPEAQHQLRNIPPSSRIDHPKLSASLKHYEAALVDEREARQTHVQAEQELPAAQFKDEQALAASKLAKKADPGPVEEEAHLALIRECRRQWGASKILLGQAVEAVVAAGAEHGPAWEASLVEERDQLRGVMGELLAGWERSWALLQSNAANRSVARGSSASQAPEYWLSQLKVPRVFDGDVIQVGDVLSGLRDLAKPEEPKDVEPVQHRPLSAAPFASAGSSSQSLGRTVPDERVAEWARKDAQEASARADGLTEERRAERLGRAAERKAGRELVQEADTEAVAATR